MKHLFTLLLTMLFLNSISAQQSRPIVIKNDQVLLKGNTILRYKKVMATELSFYNANNEEVLVYLIKDKSTKLEPYNSYVIINFLQERIKLVSDINNHLATTFGLSSQKSAENLLNWLYTEKVINDDGTINREKAEAFQWKYNDEMALRGNKTD